jgi:hypothetical protein
MGAGSDFWNRFAPRYADRTHVFYELTNEPVGWTPKDYRDHHLRDFEKLYKICDDAAPETPIVILSFANVGYNGATPEEVASKLQGIDWNKTVVGFHSYHRRDTRRFQGLHDAFPCFNTEFENQGTTGNMKVTTHDGVKYAYHASLMEVLGISWLQWDNIDTEWATQNRLPPMLNDLKQKNLYWEPDNYEMCDESVKASWHTGETARHGNRPLWTISQGGITLHRAPRSSSKVTIVGLNGTVVMEYDLHSSHPVIPVSQLSAGSYIISITGDGTENITAPFSIGN